MRTIIHLRWEKRVYKLLWVTEDAKGFYFGQYGPTDDDGVGGGPHESYHADGKRHYRLSRSREPLQERYDTPIGDVTDVRLLGTHASDSSSGKLSKR